jgi:GTP-binding protein
VRDPGTGELLADLTSKGARFVLLRGGKGGKGNSNYATAVNQAPRYAQKGIEGEEREVRVELHLIADVGLVGKPNAGKSTLISVLTNARPLVADYPFTTKRPYLGLLRLPERDIVVADIPGIIEGASEGRGLGLRFLRHVERCSALLYLVDLDAEDCASTVRVLESELRAYARSLAARPRLIVGTKLDRENAPTALVALSSSFPDDRVIGVSSFSREGIQELTKAILGLAGGRG